MKLASNLAFLKRKQFNNNSKQKAPEVDTNVVGIGFNILKDVQNNIHQGDPILCKKCQAVLNSYSKVISSQDLLGQQQKQEIVINSIQQAKQKIPIEEESKNNKLQFEQTVLLKLKENQLQVQEHESVWVCEFCNEINVLQVEREEIPVKEDVVYIVQSAQQVQEGQQNLQAEQSVVLCIDTSGSMSTTTEVKGQVNLKHGISQEEYEMLKQFIDPGDENQMFPNQYGKQVTHISRKQCVLAAIENQVNEMSQNNPNKIIGLVTFNNEVVLMGDGFGHPQTIAGDRLYKPDEIRGICSSEASKLMSHPIKESCNTLIQRFSKIQEKGQTALGPALLASVELAKAGKPGSMVILCTDGLANLGTGGLDQTGALSDQSLQFYQQIAQDAKSKGISISIVTIKGEGCRMDIIGQLAEQTNGNVTRVVPSEIGKDFANILKDEIVGTQVVLVVKIHHALNFRNEDNGVSEDGTILRREVGNATVNTQVTFEYELKNDEELQKNNINIQNIKEVPFQAKIEYTSLNGDKLLRVITRMVKTTDDLKKAEKETEEIRVIHTRIQQNTAKHVRNKSFQRAQEYNDQWGNYIESNEVMNNDSFVFKANADFKQKNMQLQKVAAKQEKRKSKPVSKQNNIDKVQDKQQQEQQGFFSKLFSTQKSQKPQPIKKEDSPKFLACKSSMRKMSVESMQSLSDEDNEEAEIQQFYQAKY